MGVDPTKISDPPAPPPPTVPPVIPPPTPAPPGAKTPLEALPQDVQDYIKELRAEAEEGRKKAAADVAAAKKAAADKLAAQGEYKTLAEQHEARVKELEPVSERYTALTAQITKQIEADIKEWPAEVKAFDPGKDAPIEQRLAWLEKARPLLEKIQGAPSPRGAAPGNGPNPRPAQKPSAQENAEELMRRGRQSGMYGF